VNANPTEKRPSLADLARDFVVTDDDVAAGASRRVPMAPAGVELALDDLISDDNGEIVFFNDSGFRTLSITTSSSVVSNGQTGRHATAAGEDVSGFNYVTFDNGTTLYFEEGLDLLLPQS
jgi:hypothetical protein